MPEPPQTALQSLMTDLSDKDLSRDQQAVILGLKIQADRDLLWPKPDAKPAPEAPRPAPNETLPEAPRPDITDKDEPEPPEAINSQPLPDEDGA